jgi:hypothetical protein
MREEFLNKRTEKIRESEQLTQRRHVKRQKKKERQRQLKKKMKFIQKLDKTNQHPQQTDHELRDEDDPNDCHSSQFED